MSWVRIHDGALTHPKIIGLTDKAFRLWVWGLSYAQQHLTDGILITGAVPPRLKRAAEDLVTNHLWDVHDLGFKVHDYLDWNDSREAVISKREGARNRLQRWTDKRVVERVSERVANADLVTPLARSGVGSSSSLKEEKTDDAVYQRAGRLREELYPAWYAKHRHGARLRLVANSLEFQEAVQICRTWDDSRIEKLAAIVLTTDDEPFIQKSDRGFRIFAVKASWADDRLTQWEREQAKKGAATA